MPCENVPEIFVPPSSVLIYIIMQRPKPSIQSDNDIWYCCAPGRKIYWKTVAYVGEVQVKSKRYKPFDSRNWYTTFK